MCFTKNLLKRFTEILYIFCYLIVSHIKMKCTYLCDQLYMAFKVIYTHTLPKNSIKNQSSSLKTQKVLLIIELVIIKLKL